MGRGWGRNLRGVNSQGRTRSLWVPLLGNDPQWPQRGAIINSAKIKYQEDRSATNISPERGVSVLLKRKQSLVKGNGPALQNLQPLAGLQRSLIDVKKTRRRIEDALRKTATEEEIIDIANFLKVKVEGVKIEKCNRCGQLDYLACDEYRQGIILEGGSLLCYRCKKRA